MAHPTANGFLGSKFPAGGIPAAYTLIMRKFFDLVEKNGVSLTFKWNIFFLATQYCGNNLNMALCSQSLPYCWQNKEFL